MTPNTGATQAGGVASAATLRSGTSGSALIGPAGALSTIKPVQAGTAAGLNGGNKGGGSGGVTIGAAISGSGSKKSGRNRMKPKLVWHKRNGYLSSDYDVPAADCNGQSPCKNCKSPDKALKQCHKTSSCKSVQWSRTEKCGYLKTANTNLGFITTYDPDWTLFSKSA